MTHQLKQKSVLQKWTLDSWRDLIWLLTDTLSLYSVLKVRNEGPFVLLTRSSSAAPAPCWRFRLCWSFHCTGSSWWTPATRPQTWRESHLSHWCWEAEWKLWQRQNTNTFNKPHSETFFCLSLIVIIGWERDTLREENLSVRFENLIKIWNCQISPSCTPTMW